MGRRIGNASLKVGLTDGKAWIATRTFDGVETDLTDNVEDMDLAEVRFVHAELGKLIPEMEAAELAEKTKRRDDLLKRKREIEIELRAVTDQLETLPAIAPANHAVDSQPFVCPECGKQGCDGDGVGHYRG